MHLFVRWRASLKDAALTWTLRTSGGSAAGTFVGLNRTSEFETTRAVGKYMGGQGAWCLVSVGLWAVRLLHLLLLQHPFVRRPSCLHTYQTATIPPMWHFVTILSNQVSSFLTGCYLKRERYHIKLYWPQLGLLCNTILTAWDSQTCRIHPMKRESTVFTTKLDLLFSLPLVSYHNA